MKRKITCFLILIIMAVFILACNLSQIKEAVKSSGITPAPELIATVLPEPTSAPLPTLMLSPEQFYFSLDGQPAFMLSRNVTGKTQEDFAALLEYSRQGGTKLLRIHLTHGWWGDPWINSDWTVNESWARNWDWFFDQAEASGIYVLPVFAVWADWNTGAPDYGSPFWQYNPLNKANGGPLDSPTGLFVPGSDEQKLWLAWVKTLVKRWQRRSNIAGWELFSEINIASAGPGYSDAKGAVSAAAAVDFVNAAANAVRSVEDLNRPLTLSLAVGAPFTNEWGAFYENNNIDFIEIHPYIDTLDRELVTIVQQNLERYQKPVMIGESGFWSAEEKDNTPIGIKHAIWAGMVSGAMNGRSLWANDGYAIYSTDDRSLAFQYFERYDTTELPIANFAKGVDFTGFEPLESTSTEDIWGAAIGNNTCLLGWYRDASCEPPDYLLRKVISNQKVTITVPGNGMNWKVEFYSADDGITLLGSINIVRVGKNITIPLPDFHDDIAIKAAAQ